MRLRTLFPFSWSNRRVGHALFSLTRELADTDLGAELWVARCGAQVRPNFVHTVAPDKAVALGSRINRLLQPQADWARKALEWRYAAAFREGDIAHVYRGCSAELVEALRAKGHPILLECASLMDHMSERISLDAFARAGWPVDHPFSQQRLDAAQARVDAVDFLFSPSPAVTQSLLERGVAEQKILECSYGWEPARFAGRGRALPEIKGVTVLLVGSVSFGKGAHLLLDAWSRAGVVGRLVLVGEMDPLIAKHCAEHLRRKDVVYMPFTPDPAPVYRSADIFALPTLEEGSPLVGYEAMGNGLAVITSPVGAGRVIRHGREGLVLDPHDREGWVRALRELAYDVDLRRALGEAGRIRAEGYTWDKVARRRYDLIKKVIPAPRNRA